LVTSRSADESIFSGARVRTDRGRQPRTERDHVLRGGIAATLLDGVLEGDRLTGLVVEGDLDRPGLEDLPDALADEIDDRLELQLPGQRRPDLVDDGQLAGPLLGLRQQPFRLVEQAGVLERDAHARRERAQQPHIGVVERVLRHALEGDHAEDPIAGGDGHP
jgi:hypothetical protein